MNVEFYLGNDHDCSFKYDSLQDLYKCKSRQGFILANWPNWRKNKVQNMENCMILIDCVYRGKEAAHWSRNRVRGVKLSVRLKLVSTFRVVEQFNL